MLELRNLTRVYQLGAGEPVRALNGASLSVSAGEFVAVYGPSGSGKTTLLELIAGLQRPDSGQVIVDGQDIHAWPLRKLEEYRRNTVGIVGHPQNLIPGARAIENASLKLWLTDPRHATGRVEALFEELGLSARLHHRTEELSMGERQRVLIARALATSPRLLLADEPTGSLDSTRTLETLGLIRAQCERRGMTVILATHDPQAAGFADQVLRLRDGRLEEHDEPSIAGSPT